LATSSHPSGITVSSDSVRAAAEHAVSKAEALKTTGSISIAKAIVTALPNGTDKIVFMNRISAVETLNNQSGNTKKILKGYFGG